MGIPMNNIWISIASIIVPSIIAILIGWWQIKTMRALASPTVNPDKKRNEKQSFGERYFSSRRFRFLISGLYMIYPIFALTYEFNLVHEFTRWCVLDISFFVCLMFFIV